MEASSLKIKKQIQKGKLKKTMKNIICRPDPTYWPLISEIEDITLTEELNILKLDIPDFKKPHWSELSNVPKNLRQKPPPIPKVNGLIFGITECKRAIEMKQCVGILIDDEVNPKSIVQPLIDICLDKSIPVLCLKKLRNTTDNNFGIPTSVLGVKQNLLLGLEKTFLEIAKTYRPNIRQTCAVTVTESPTKGIQLCNGTNSNVTDEDDIEGAREWVLCPYLYRVSKSSRTFSPALAAKNQVWNNNLTFINVPNSVQNGTTNNKPLLKMNVKKISSNLNRRKVIKPNTKD